MQVSRSEWYSGLLSKGPPVSDPSIHFPNSNAPSGLRGPGQDRRSHQRGQDHNIAVNPFQGLPTKKHPPSPSFERRPQKLSPYLPSQVPCPDPQPTTMIHPSAVEHQRERQRAPFSPTDPTEDIDSTTSSKLSEKLIRIAQQNRGKPEKEAHLRPRSRSNPTLWDFERAAKCQEVWPSPGVSGDRGRRARFINSPKEA
jgi:hypothetical protein